MTKRHQPRGGQPCGVQPACCNRSLNWRGRHLVKLATMCRLRFTAQKPSLHFPVDFKMTQLTPLNKYLKKTKYRRISSLRQVQRVGRESVLARRLLLQGVILSALFRGRIEIPKGNMINLLPDNKPLSDHYRRSNMYFCELTRADDCFSFVRAHMNKWKYVSQMLHFHK